MSSPPTPTHPNPPASNLRKRTKRSDLHPNPPLDLSDASDQNSDRDEPSSQSTQPVIASQPSSRNIRKHPWPQSRDRSQPEAPEIKPVRSPSDGSQAQVAFVRLQTSFWASLEGLWRVLLWPLRFMLAIIIPNTLGSLLAYGMVVGAMYWFGASLSGLLARVALPSSLSLFSASLSPVVSTLVSPITFLYCTTLNGPFCAQPVPSEADIAQVARTVSGTAKKAADIFDSVAKLSSPDDLGLHQSEIKELGYAVRWSSELVGKEALGEGLSELSGLTRDVKDRMVELNGQGLNAFSFIAHEFSRLGDLIEWVQSGKKRYTSKTVAQNLEILFDHLATELNKLLNAIESSIPLVCRASDLGMGVSERLHQEHFKLQRLQERQPLWRKLLDKTSSAGRQLERDLSLTSESIVNLRTTWRKLEDIRTDLKTYRNNVVNFKSSMAGWHLADHGLTAEDELFSMRHIVDDLKKSIAQVKTNSRTTVHKINPSEPTRDGAEGLERFGKNFNVG